MILIYGILLFNVDAFSYHSCASEKSTRDAKKAVYDVAKGALKSLIVELENMEKQLKSPANKTPKQNGKHKALIRITNTRKVYYVAVGVELSAGVAVEKIESQKITLNENGKSKVYRLPL